MGVVRPDTRRPPSEGENAISFACSRFDGGSAQRLVQHGFSSVVKRLAKAVYIRFAAPSFAIQGTPFSAPIAPARAKPLRLRLASFAPKWWVMSRCAIVLTRKVALCNCRPSFKNTPGFPVPALGDDKADVEIGSGGRESPD